VRATIISVNAGADVSLLQLERVTKAMRVARTDDSDTMRVGQQVMVVGAPYGLAYSMSVGWISARWPPNTIFPSATCWPAWRRAPPFKMSVLRAGKVIELTGTSH
jgi:hypothetical protein